MSKPTIKGVQPIDQGEMAVFERQYPEIGRWLRLLIGAFPRVRTYQVTTNPGSIGAGAELVLTATVAGLQANDIVYINKPSNTAGISISQVYASDTDELTLKLYNSSGGAVDPASETYKLVAIRL